MNGCAGHLISTKQRKSKHVMVHLSHIYSLDSNQNFLPNPLYTRLFNFHKKTKSKHSSQYDFTMHGLMLGQFNLHETKQNQTHFECKKIFTSSHSSQTICIMHKRMHKSFNFNITKEYQNTLRSI